MGQKFDTTPREFIQIHMASGDIFVVDKESNPGLSIDRLSELVSDRATGLLPLTAMGFPVTVSINPAHIAFVRLTQP